MTITTIGLDLAKRAPARTGPGNLRRLRKQLSLRNQNRMAFGVAVAVEAQPIALKLLAIASLRLGDDAIPRKRLFDLRIKPFRRFELGTRLGRATAPTRPELAKTQGGNPAAKNRSGYRGVFCRRGVVVIPCVLVSLLSQTNQSATVQGVCIAWRT